MRNDVDIHQFNSKVSKTKRVRKSFEKMPGMMDLKEEKSSLKF